MAATTIGGPLCILESWTRSCRRGRTHSNLFPVSSPTIVSVPYSLGREADINTQVECISCPGSAKLSCTCIWWFIVEGDGDWINYWSITQTFIAALQQKRIQDCNGVPLVSLWTQSRTQTPLQRGLKVGGSGFETSVNPTDNDPPQYIQGSKLFQAVCRKRVATELPLSSWTVQRSRSTSSFCWVDHGVSEDNIGKALNSLPPPGKAKELLDLKRPYLELWQLVTCYTVKVGVANLVSTWWSFMCSWGSKMVTMRFL